MGRELPLKYARGSRLRMEAPEDLAAPAC